MAIMKALFAASVLASLASAIPMPGPRMAKREVAMHTVTHTTWTTVDVTTTVFVNDADPTPPPQAVVTSEAVPTAAPAPPAPAAPAQEAPSSAPAVSAGNFAQEQPTPAAPAPPASSAAAASAPQSTVNVAPKANGGVCEGEGSGCSGDVTYYNGAGGYGACGTIIDDSAMIVALPVGLMGTQSNGNPYCGRTVNIKGTDGSVHTGTVADKCMGCVGDSIDLTPALFKVVAPSGDGRVHGIEWWFS